MLDTQLVLITGMSGSGKSVALAALEDVGYYCVDNLPPELLVPLVDLQRARAKGKLAVAVDARSATGLPLLPHKKRELQAAGVRLTSLFLDATDDTLVRRFSETRRGHPLSTQPALKTEAGLLEAIQVERELLSELRDQALVIDTSLMRPAELLSQIKQVLGHQAQGLTLVFESFAFKRGIPMDADYVFDVRMLPNPHYDSALRPLTGKDAPVAAFLASHSEVKRMEQHIADFLKAWLPELKKDHRNYVTVAVGCTGGQHRSVYLVERLTAAFSEEWNARSRHRELPP